MSWFKKSTFPEYWQDYANHFKMQQIQSIESIRFVVFDTETSGLNLKSDRILSIGCIAVQNYKIVVSDQLESYLEQDVFNAETVKIHGLLKSGLTSKISEEAAIVDFLSYIQDAVLVAHHASFDIGMINYALKRLGLPKLKNKILDTGHLYRKLRDPRDRSHYSLDALSEEFDIPQHDRHTASGDAFITALLFIKLLKLLSKKSNLSLKELMRSNERIGLL